MFTHNSSSFCTYVHLFCSLILRTTTNIASKTTHMPLITRKKIFLHRRLCFHLLYPLTILRPQETISSTTRNLIIFLKQSFSLRFSMSSTFVCSLQLETFIFKELFKGSISCTLMLNFFFQVLSEQGYNDILARIACSRYSSKYKARYTKLFPPLHLCRHIAYEIVNINSTSMFIAFLY